MVICTNGAGHRMQQGRETAAVSFSDILQGLAKAPVASDGKGPTDIICGVFLLQNTHYNPLVNSLPPSLHLDAQKRQYSSAIGPLFELLTSELDSNRAGQSYMLERQFELLYAETIRLHSRGLSEKSKGWLKAIEDPRLGKALDYIHNHIEQTLSVAVLAQQVNLSPSRFSAYFKEVMGLPPLSYITQWRMHCADNILLEDPSRQISEIAYDLGYGSLAAFNRAFTKFAAMSPSARRKQLLTQHSNN